MDFNVEMKILTQDLKHLQREIMRGLACTPGLHREISHLLQRLDRLVQKMETIVSLKTGTRDIYRECSMEIGHIKMCLPSDLLF